MKYSLTIFLLCVLSAAASAADEDTLAKARGLLLGGKYAEAADVYAPPAAKDPAAALGLARCLAAEGKREAAVRTLTAVAGDHAVLYAELARLAFERGDHDEAKTRCERAIELDGDQLLARWVRAELDRTAGRLDEAGRRYGELMSYYNTHEVKDAESLRWIGLAAARYAQWNRMPEQFRTLVDDLYPAALKLEPGYWSAHYEAGRLFLEKHNLAEAARHFRAALELNPNAAEVHVAMARWAVAQRDPEQAAASIDRALQIDPRLLDAWLAKADLAWSNFEVRQALKLLERKALPLNPIDEETLGRMGACYLLLDVAQQPRQSARLSKLVEQVVRRNPHAGDFFFALGVALRARNKLPEAERFLRRAIEVMPRGAGPRGELGLLKMRTGREAEAQRWLREAFDADPFNTRVHNMLSVLDLLDTMETLETEHLVIKYDGRHDALLARYAARHAEAVYGELCEQFGYRPPGKPLLEIFNRAKAHDGHQWFSTRMIGLPYVGTVAASTGYLVAMVSPNEPRARRQFNWARVLRHELVHVVTLQQTRFNIPHWFTEGLAVHSEGGPRPQAWNELLIARVPRGKLFDLRTINFGFTRPQNGRDWQMAYCQAELYVEFIRSRWDADRQRKLLAAFAEVLDTDKAIRRVLGVSIEQFERQYNDYLKEITVGLSRLKHPSAGDFAPLLRAHRDRPGDADAAAELAYAYLRRRLKPEARAAAEAALKVHPKHQLATYVVARLRLAQGRTPEAIELLQECLDTESPQPNVLNLLAGLKLKARQYDEAARLYRLGARLDAINLKWLKSLARVYLLADDREKLAEVLSRLAEADGDDLTSRKKLARLALERRDYLAAAKWANQAIQIDVASADMHRVFAESLVNRHNYPRAIEEYEVAVELSPKEAYLRYALADAYLQARRPGEARRVLQALLKMAPDYPGAALMMENLP